MSEINIDNYKELSMEGQKKYKQYLLRANKNEILKRLPALHQEAFEKIDCLSCANCCKNYSPRFKTPDIKRIAKHFKMKEGAFIEQYLVLDNDGDYVVISKPCPFLEADNKCGIYEVRPSDCRRFPYTDEDVFFKRTAITLKNATFCPIVVHVMERLIK
ncbi:MAG: YkgJ family cysteine cluster protein [Ferruginibacter sp.]